MSVTSPAGVPTRGRGRPGRETAGDVREQILRAASESFARSGYAATSMSGIGRQVGVAPRAVHHHFETKRDLFRACYDRAFSSLLRLVAANWTEAGSGSDQLAWLGEVSASIIQAAEADRDLAAFISTAPLELRRNPELAGIVGEIPDAVEAIVGRAAAELVSHGAVASGVSAETLAHLLTAVTLGVTQYVSVIEPGKADLREPFELLVTGGLFRD